MPDAPRIRLPKRPSIDIYSINKESAIKLTQERRDNLFKEQREKLYKELNQAANSGIYFRIFTFDERVNRKDIRKLKTELELKGFSVEMVCDVCDQLKISWYPV